MWSIVGCLAVTFAYLLGPAYVVSRVVMAFYPVIALATGHPGNDFLTVISLLYSVGLVVCVCMLVPAWRNQWDIWHVEEPESYDGYLKKFLSRVRTLHQGIIWEPQRNHLIEEHFGADLGAVVMSYVPHYWHDDEDTHCQHVVSPGDGDL